MGHIVTRPERGNGCGREESVKNAECQHCIRTLPGHKRSHQTPDHLYSNNGTQLQVEGKGTVVISLNLGTYMRVLINDVGAVHSFLCREH